MQQQVTVQHHQHQPVVPSGETKQYHNYQSQSSLSLGALQVIVGILAILFNIIGIAIEAANSPVSHGIWSGIFFIITGSLGIVASKQKTGCSITAFMVLSILSAILCVFLLSIAAAGVEDDKDQYCYFGYCWRYDMTDDSDRDARIAMNALLVALALIEAIIAIWSSAVCCATVCCGASSRNGGVIQSAHTVHYINNPVQPQVMVISGQPVHGVIQTGQPMVQTGQPMVQTGQPMVQGVIQTGQPMGQHWAQPSTFAVQQGDAQVHMPAHPPAYYPPGYTNPAPGGATGSAPPGGASGNAPPVQVKQAT